MRRKIVVKPKEEKPKIKRRGKKWIVLWVKGGRIGSFKNQKKTLQLLKEKFSMSLIQTDITGTLHYTIFGVIKNAKKKNRNKRKAKD